MPGGANHHKPIEQRFWEKVERTDSCWLWHGAYEEGRYGRFWDGARFALAHRWAYEFLRGPIPAGYVIDHLCRVTRCVNPDHLEPVTPRENIMRSPTAPTAVRARQDRCIHGHPFNRVVLRRDGIVERVCTECRRQRKKAARAQWRAAAAFVEVGE